MIKRPKTVGALVGLLTGTPQGLSLPEFVDPNLPGFAEAGPVVIGFGLLAPPILVGINLLIQNGRPHPWWDKVNRYFDMYQYMVWGCLALAASGLYTLSASSASNPAALTLSGFFAAGGVGFFLASVVESKLRAASRESQRQT